MNFNNILSRQNLNNLKMQSKNFKVLSGDNSVFRFYFSWSVLSFLGEVIVVGLLLVRLWFLLFRTLLLLLELEKKKLLIQNLLNFQRTGSTASCLCFWKDTTYKKDVVLQGRRPSARNALGTLAGDARARLVLLRGGDGVPSRGPKGRRLRVHITDLIHPLLRV